MACATVAGRRGDVIVAWLASWCAAALFAQTPTQPSAPQRAAVVDEVASIGMTVSDLDRATTFFTEVLAFEKVNETRASGDGFARQEGLAPGAKARVARMRLGDEFIELTAYESLTGRSFPDDSRGNDRWFQHIAIVVRDMDLAYETLSTHGVRPASKGGPQRLPDWNKNAGGIRAYYFRDPDGHFLELIEFPPDKGNPKWHRPTDKLFLGIDHTAIVVGDTDESLRFYRDVLGFVVAGASENQGPEQEALNNVPGAHLRITAMRAPRGPGIEFLEYLQPRDGRAFPADVRATDLLHWETTLASSSAGELTRRLHASDARFVSASADTTGASQPEARSAVLIRDPDGHALKIIDR